jgi:hypothetical protein
MRWLVLALWAQVAGADPILSIAGTMAADQDYDRVLQALDDVGAEATTLTLMWDEMEVGGVYAPADDWPTIANIVYPANGLKIGLMIAVVDTVADRRPADLRDLPYDDPLVIARFTAFLTEVLARMPDVDLVSIGIGNEVDGVLRGQDWGEYARFFTAAQDAALRLRPDVPVGMTMTAGGVFGPEAEHVRELAGLGSVWMVNFYPLLAGFEIADPAEVADELDGLLQAAGDKPVYLTEVGYPSGGCGASEAGQLAFTQNVLAYAQTHADRMPLVNLVWLHDLSDAEVDQYVGYYGVSGDCFARYLATLGLRTQDGEDKPVFGWLRDR